LDLKLNHAFESISRLLQAQEHPCQCFQALTTLFPSISRYSRSHTLADKQDGNSNNDPTLSLCQTTHSPGSFRSHNDGSYKDLRTFTASLLVHFGLLSTSWSPHHGDNKTNIDQSVLACIHTFNVHSSTTHSKFAVAILTCATGTPADPTADSKRHALLSARI